MSLEIELKLLLPPRQLTRLRASPILAEAPGKQQKLTNTYYDTADCLLSRSGVALRFRRRGWDWLLTVKSTDLASAGLARRQEWEVPARPGEFDFRHVTDKRLRKLLSAHADRLEPVFTTVFQRQTWIVERDGCRVEVAADRGHIESRGVRTPISEVELELIDGTDPAALFAIALELSATVPLHPEGASKAERGYQLYAPTAPAPARSGASPVTADLTPVEAFRAIALDCLAHLQRNEAGAIVGEDPEYVHQARVAIRRLRSAMGLFAPYLPPELRARFGPQWRDTAQAMGGARDWDVLLDETLPPLEEAFPGHRDLIHLRKKGERMQARAAGAAKVALKSPAYSRLLIEFGAALAALDGRDASPRSRRLAGHAARLLDKRLAQILKRTRDLRNMPAEARHELRIAFKKLRYALEFFTPLLPAKAARNYLAALNHLQKRLGHLNDIATAQGLVSDAFGRSPSALVQGWFAGQQGILLSALLPEVDHFVALAAPWRRKS